MKKVCIVTHDDWETFSGGVSRFVREIAPRLSHHFEMTVLVTRAQNKEKILQVNPNLKVIKIPSFRVPKTVIEIPGFSRKIKSYLKEADLVFVQTLEGTYPLMHALRMKKPLVLYFHGLDWEIFVRAMGLVKFRFFFVPLVKKFWGYWYRKANHICLPSLQYEKYLQEGRIKAPHTWVPLGVDVKRFSPSDNKKIAQEKLGLNTENIYLGFVGRFWPDKNIEFLLKVFSLLVAKNPSLRLLMVGQGYKKYEKMIQEEENIVWVGYQDNVIPYLRAMDIYCQPMLPTETSSLSTMEAMACGLPVVVNAVSCPKEYIQDGINGFLVDPPNHLDLFVKKIQCLIDSPSWRNKVGLRACQTINEKFSWDHSAQLLKNILNGLLKP